MIPKIIHYCWFGRGKKNEIIIKCIESWKRILPDYQIVEWNEDSFDIEMNHFVKEAYDAKKWAFITDYVRLYALNKFGGIYLDSDVEVLRPLDRFLDHRAFSGFEDNNLIPTGIMASEKEHPWILKLLMYYDNRHFIKDNGQLDMRPNTKIISEISEKYFGYESEKANANDYLVLKDDLHIYPWYFFCPKSHLDGRVNLKDDSYTIHHFNGSWLTKKQKIIKFMINYFVRFFGESKYQLLRNKYRSLMKKSIYD